MTKIDKNIIKRIYNYSLKNIAAFCSARNDLKTLCLKLASEPLFLILAFHLSLSANQQRFYLYTRGLLNLFRNVMKYSN